MSVVLDLPHELLEFVLADTPQTMLLRGPPGTGKTIFSLALLNSFPGRRVYVSSRVQQKELYREFPWLRTSGDRIDTVDAANWSGGARQTAEMLAGARKLVSEPAESRALHALWLPEPIQEMWSRLDPRSPTMVVIDSWDAMIEQYFGFAAPNGYPAPDRPQIERLLLDQMARAAVFLVLVTERDELTQLDYLVNGVVQTRWDRSNHRPERWLRLSKLRGVRIDTDEYPFTLEGGRFSCITPLTAEYRPYLTHAIPEPDPQPGRIWPGNPEFAAVFGRLPVRRLSLLETELNVPNEAVSQVLAPIAAHVVGKGGRLVLVLPPTVFPDDIWDIHRRIANLEQFQRQVRIQSVAPEVSDDVRPMILPSPRSSGGPTEPRLVEALKFLQEASPATPNLMIVWTVGLQAVASMQGFQYAAKDAPPIVLTYLTKAPVHILFIGPVADPIMHELQAIASTRINFSERNGRIFIAGEKPMTPPFVLTVSEETGSYHLVRVV